MLNKRKERCRRILQQPGEIPQTIGMVLIPELSNKVIGIDLA